MSDAGQFFTNRVLKDFKEKYAFLYYFFSLLHFFCMHLSFFTSWTQIILNWKFGIAFVDQLCGSVQLVDEWYFLSNHLVAVCTGQRGPAEPPNRHRALAATLPQITRLRPAYLMRHGSFFPRLLRLVVHQTR